MSTLKREFNRFGPVKGAYVSDRKAYFQIHFNSPTSARKCVEHWKKTRSTINFAASIAGMTTIKRIELYISSATSSSKPPSYPQTPPIYQQTTPSYTPTKSSIPRAESSLPPSGLGQPAIYTPCKGVTTPGTPLSQGRTPRTRPLERAELTSNIMLLQRGEFIGKVVFRRARGNCVSLFAAARDKDGREAHMDLCGVLPLQLLEKKREVIANMDVAWMEVSQGKDNAIALVKALLVDTGSFGLIKSSGRDFLLLPPCELTKDVPGNGGACGERLAILDASNASSGASV